MLILPFRPFTGQNKTKNRTAGTNRGAAEISEPNVDDKEVEITSLGSKSGEGLKTGVKL